MARIIGYGNMAEVAMCLCVCVSAIRKPQAAPGEGGGRTGVELALRRVNIIFFLTLKL